VTLHPIPPVTNIEYIDSFINGGSEIANEYKKGNLITAIRCLRNRSKSVAYWGAFALFEIKNTQRHFYPCVWYFKQKLNMKLYRSDALLLSEPFCSKHLNERNITRQANCKSDFISADNTARYYLSAFT